MDDSTQKKIDELMKENKPLGCLACLGFVDDGQHQYEKQNHIWYCPALEE